MAWRETIMMEQKIEFINEWRSTKWVMVSTTLIDKYVGLEELGEGIWRIYFRQKMLGYFDEIKLRIMDETGRFKRNNV